MNTCKSQVLRTLRNQIGPKGMPLMQQNRLSRVLCEICKEPDQQISTLSADLCKQEQVMALKSLLRSGVSAAERNAIRKALCAICSPQTIQQIPLERSAACPCR